MADPKPSVSKEASLGPYPRSIQDQDRVCLDQRRAKLGQPTTDPKAWPWKNSIGLALSGGGIRSATFSLGFLQALASLALKRGESTCKGLPAVDVLSTVSGGGYIGAFLGGLFEKRRKGSQFRPDLDQQGAEMEEVLNDLTHPGSPSLRFLRENGRYLTPGGSGDMLQGGMVAIRNFVALHVVMGMFALLGFLCLDLFRGSAIALIRPWMHPTLLIGHTFHGIWWSPWLFIPALVALYGIVPIGWAYWLVGNTRSRIGTWPIATWVVTGTVGILAITAAFVSLRLPELSLLRIFGATQLKSFAVLALLGIEAGLALTAMILAEWVAWLNRRRNDTAGEALDLGPRRRLSTWLRGAALIVLFGLYLALLDSLAQNLYRLWAEPHLFPALITSLGGLSAILIPIATKAQKIVKFFEEKFGMETKSTRVPWGVVAGCVAFLVGTLLLVTVAFTAKGICFGWQVPVHVSRPEVIQRLGIAALTALVLSLLFGRTFEFLNQSSLGPYYCSMLTRAYLGASNEVRQASVQSPPYVVEGDDVPFETYRPHQHGGPLHLINVCLNETTGGESQVTQRDRKGMSMAVGPAGLSVGVRHHICWGTNLPKGSGQDYGVFLANTDTQAFQPESLSVGRWMGISGAAVSTGMGQATRLSYALLCGVFNVRLGYWWNSGISPWKRYGGSATNELARTFRYFFSVQSHTFDEFLAQFPGTSTQQWYLSDGGHFENLGVYELLRRRIPFILSVDADADPDIELKDLENLVRLARVDLQADIRFLSKEELLAQNLGSLVAEGVLGPLEDLRRGTWDAQNRFLKSDRKAFSRCQAALARITYANLGQANYSEASVPVQGWLLFVKPTLLAPLNDTRDLPVDVYKYHEHHPDFPHEKTADQFFDESQWESYRKLGEHIGGRLLGCLPGTASNPLWNLLP